MSQLNQYLGGNVNGVMKTGLSAKAKWRISAGCNIENNQ
jgi:hypothetical protein